MAEVRRQLVIVEKATPGVKNAFAYPPDTVPAPLPAFVNVMDSGEFVTPRMMGWRQGDHIVKAKCLIQYQSSLEEAERKIENIVRDFVDTVDHYKTLSDTEFVIDCDVLRYEAGTVTLPNQEQPFIAVSFDVLVREHQMGSGVRYAAAG